MKIISFIIIFDLIDLIISWVYEIIWLIAKGGFPVWPRKVRFFFSRASVTLDGRLFSSLPIRPGKFLSIARVAYDEAWSCGSHEEWHLERTVCRAAITRSACIRKFATWDFFFTIFSLHSAGEVSIYCTDSIWWGVIVWVSRVALRENCTGWPSRGERARGTRCGQRSGRT